MDQNLSDVVNRLDAIERELSELKLKLAALSTNRRGTKRAVNRYLALRDEVSEEWTGEPSVLDEFRKSRGHENQPS
jgi:hypothetical protein